MSRYFLYFSKFTAANVYGIWEKSYIVKAIAIRMFEIPNYIERERIVAKYRHRIPANESLHLERLRGTIVRRIYVERLWSCFCNRYRISRVCVRACVCVACEM